VTGATAAWTSTDGSAPDRDEKSTPRAQSEALRALRAERSSPSMAQVDWKRPVIATVAPSGEAGFDEAATRSGRYAPDIAPQITRNRP